MREPNKCDRCFNSRLILSENGYHYGCALPPKQAARCMTGEKDLSNPTCKKIDGGKQDAE